MDKTPIAGIVSVLAIASYAFVGFDTIPQAAEEFDFSAKKTIVILIIAIFFGASLYVGINTIAASVVPAEYNSWVEYVRDIDNLSGVKATPSFNAAKELLGNFGLTVIGLAVLAALISGIVGFYMASSRLLYAVSKEKMLPEWFGKLHPKYKTPKNAIVFVMASGYGYTSASAFKFALKDKKIGIMITGGIGTIFSVVCAVILLVPISGLKCSLGKESYICLIVWVAMGVIFYLCRQYKNKRK